MIVSELITALQKLPQDATVIVPGYDYPQPAQGVSIIRRANFDGYYTPEWWRMDTNKNCVVRIG